MRYLASVALCLLFLAPSHAESPPPVVSFDGLMHYIIEHDGKLVLVNFWATWCGPCQKEIPGLMKLRDKYDEEELHIVGVSLDYDPGALARQLRDQPFNYPILLADSDLMSLLKIRSLPKTLLYDRQGREVFNYDGYVTDDQLDRWIQKVLRNQ